MRIIAPIIILTLALLIPANYCQAAENFSKIWEETMPLMSKGMEIMAQGNADKRSWGEILTFRDPKFKRLLAQCFEILADSETIDLLDKRDKLLDRIKRKNHEIVELQKEQIAAPDEHWNPLKLTKSKIKDRIADLRGEIEGLKQEIERAKEEARASIEARGIPITKEQIDALLTAADGKDTASIMAVAENIKQIQVKIEEVAQSPDSSVELLKTYTGIYMMCHKVYAYAISHALEQIKDVYLPKLGHFQKEAQSLLQNARGMLSEAQDNDRRILETNIIANQRTLEVIRLYTQYLRRQEANLKKLEAKALKSAEVAVNTYRTVKTSTELLSMMRRSYQEFSQIFTFEPPSVSLLYDERLRGEFEQITSKLRLND